MAKDTIDKFAELQRKRVNGEISEAEYESQREVLKQNENAESEAPQGASTRLSRKYMLLLGGAVAILGAGSLALMNRDSLALPSISGDNPWVIEETVNKMTDARFTTAKRTVSGEQTDIDLTIICAENGNIAYLAEAYDKSGEAREIAGQDGYVAGRWQRLVTFSVRADQGKSHTVYSGDINRLNFVKLSYPAMVPSWQHLWEVEELARGSTARMALKFAAGNEVFEWRQSDQRFKLFIEPCLLAADNRRERAQLSEANEIAEYEARVETSRSDAEEKANQAIANERQFSEEQERRWENDEAERVAFGVEQAARLQAEEQELEQSRRQIAVEAKRKADARNAEAEERRRQTEIRNQRDQEAIRQRERELQSYENRIG